MEYARFGETIIQREDSSQEWGPVTPGMEVDAQVAVEVAAGDRQRNLEGAGGAGIQITRSPQNIEIAEKFGITADQLAERLASPTDNQGTVTRLSEVAFDAEMKKLGLSGGEGRARFKGTYWQE